ncbi:terminase large subunit domain-containing protein [Variovorax sp. UC74_104]|uniref:terminase large subunit domain-containing protein n=1 Tax=Variovorax sp. UC74_104 TaxID=3374555 RepID=UPI003756EC21
MPLKSAASGRTRRTVSVAAKKSASHQRGRASNVAKAAAPAADVASVASTAAGQIATLTPQAQPRTAARFLAWTGWKVKQIAEHLGVPASTVYGWKEADKWDDAQPLDRVNGALEVRLIQLILKTEKTGGDYKEIDLLGRQLERTARVEKYQQTGREGDLNPNIAARNAAPKRKPKRNEFNEDQIALLESKLRESNFPFHQAWFDQQYQRLRAILKSRQIGATFYFSREALLSAAKEGRNKLFLSASKAQAHQFRSYIVDFAKEVDVDLKGENIKLWNGAELIFLGTNAMTAQSYHGDFYFDEFFWVPRFRMINKLASAMASHKHWRKTYFSTPSAMSHEAYGFWTGDDRNKGRAKKDHVRIDTTHKALRGGALGLDRKWRDIVTVEDAVALGFDLFDIAELREEYSVDEFANLFMCQFIDDSLSLFTLAQMQACMVDSWETWSDVKPLWLRPYAHHPVWIGYDPSDKGDAAALVVVAPPRVPGGKFRILHREQFKGSDFEAQAEAIRRVTQQYNVVHIGIDKTGLGAGVFQIVEKFFPQVKGYQYSIEVKQRLVLKAQQVIHKGRLEFDAGWTDIAASFMAIKRVLTASGRNVTYDSGRSEETGHADLAWATMHALDNETLAGDVVGGSSRMEIFG